MAGLSWAGPDPQRSRAVETRLDATERIEASRGLTYVTGRAMAQAAPLAAKADVDAADSLYAPASYYQSQDALLVPTTARGAIGGVAALDSSGKIPPAQVPPLGYGTVKGPYGRSEDVYSVAGGSTTPQPLARVLVGVSALRAILWVSCQALITAAGDARPVLEVRVGSPADTSYAAQTPVALGRGMAGFNDAQAVSVTPLAHTPTAPDLDVVLTAWCYTASPTGTVTASTATVTTFCVYLCSVAP